MYNLNADKTKSTKPTVVQLAKGAVEEVQNIKGHDYVIKLTSTLQGERSVYLSFNDEKEFSKWLRKTKKVSLLIYSKTVDLQLSCIFSSEQLISSLEKRSGRAIVLPPASALAWVSASINVSFALKFLGLHYFQVL